MNEIISTWPAETGLSVFQNDKGGTRTEDMRTSPSGALGWADPARSSKRSSHQPRGHTQNPEINEQEQNNHTDNQQQREEKKESRTNRQQLIFAVCANLCGPGVVGSGQWPAVAVRYNNIMWYASIIVVETW